MERLGINDAQALSLVAECREIALKLEKIRAKYGIYYLEIRTGDYCNPEVAFQEIIHKKGVERTVSNFEIADDYIKADDVFYSMEKTSDNEYQE